MKNFIGQGGTLEITADTDYSSGDVIAVSGLFGIAAGDIANGENGIINIAGIYELAKDSEQAWTAGAPLYWTGTLASTTEEDNDFIGFAALAQGPGGETGPVLLGAWRPPQTIEHPIAAFVADAASGSAAEINALRDALVTAGLMESE